MKMKMTKYASLHLNGAVARDQWVFIPDSERGPMHMMAKDEKEMMKGEPETFHGGSDAPEMERMKGKMKEMMG